MASISASVAGERMLIVSLEGAGTNTADKGR